MEAVRRKSPGVCIGRFTGVLAHFRLGRFTGVLAHFRLGWVCTVQWKRCNGSGAMEAVQWKRCGASRPVFALSWLTGVLAHFRLGWDWLFQFHSIESKDSIISPA
jgi:hypothetical protein